MNDRFLKACRREPVDCTPVWLMRQAGRYMAEYRKLRERHPILEMIKTPELAAEVTLQPVRAFDLDAAIIFSDILPVLECLGLPLTFISGKGPVIERPVTTASDVDALPAEADRTPLNPTVEAVRLVRRELDGRTPLIGFSGAPFTLACYAIEGGSSRDFEQARLFMIREPAAWHGLMERLATVIADYLCAQVDAGAQAVQLFDSWAGLLNPMDYKRFAQPYSHRILSRVRQHADVPVIHFATGSSGILPELKEAGGTVIGIDSRTDLGRARSLLGSDIAVQGNLDPVYLLAGPEAFSSHVDHILKTGGTMPGHIFNLGHGVLKQTPVEHVRALVDMVHERSQRPHAGSAPGP